MNTIWKEGIFYPTHVELIQNITDKTDTDRYTQREAIVCHNQFVCAWLSFSLWSMVPSRKMFPIVDLHGVSEFEPCVVVVCECGSDDG